MKQIKEYVRNKFEHFQGAPNINLQRLKQSSLLERYALKIFTDVVTNMKYKLSRQSVLHGTLEDRPYTDIENVLFSNYVENIYSGNDEIQNLDINK